MDVKKLIKNRKFPYVIGACIAVGIFILLFSSGDGAGIETEVVKKGTMRQKVSVTGTVRPGTDAELAFEQGGKISRVAAGQTLLVKENSELLADLAQAEAKLDGELAKLAELTIGTRQEEIDIKRKELEKAEQDLTNEYESVPNVIADARQSADIAINTNIDALFDGDNTSSPQLTFITTNQSAEFDSEFKRIVAGTALWKLGTIVATLSSADAGRDGALLSARGELAAIAEFLSRTALALDSASGLSATTLATYKTDLNTARTRVNAEIVNVDGQIQTINAHKITVEKIQNELALKIAGNTNETIAIQNATVAQAKASVQKVNAQISKTILRAPVYGVVTKQEARVGEIVSANAILVKIIGDEAYEVEANIPEADIVGVAIGNPAQVTFDALSSDNIFEASVSVIEPGETIVEGVPTYTVTLSLSSSASARVKSGMTANVNIETMKKENAVYIPSRALLRDNGRNYVRVMENDKIVERDVTVGIRDVLSNVEILGGLSEGEDVVTFIPKL